MIRKTIVHRRNRRNLGADQQPALPNTTATSSIVANKWRLSFDKPVSYSALPTTWTVNGAAPTSITQISTTVFDLGYAVNVAAGQAWVIPANSPFVRTTGGGYVNSATGTF